ncbi:hypothetical protein BJV78DRAFT_933453 [Lactifluus subvellereus]|nr:hypothetical protein BJV78DRAFT_933453 [Lactifluus subvellereus]
MIYCTVQYCIRLSQSQRSSQLTSSYRLLHLILARCSSLPTNFKNASSPRSIFIPPSRSSYSLYARVKHAASDLVVNLAVQHVHLLFPQAAFPLVVEGDGYNLHCSESIVSLYDACPSTRCRIKPLDGVALKRWSYRKTLELIWGDVRLIPSDEKWRVLFEVVD